MTISQHPFTVTDWSAVEAVEHKGETGTSVWRAVQAGPLRVRVVEYSAGYRSDHWCPRGHIFLVLEGEFGIALKDGRSFLLGPGMSFEAGDDEANPHMGYSAKGGKAFIVD
jgi:hypothetical protein